MKRYRLCPTCGCPCPDRDDPELCEHGHPFGDAPWVPTGPSPHL